MTPAACHTAASDTITAHSAGCTTSARLQRRRTVAPASTSSSDPVHVRRQRRRALGQPRREHRASTPASSRPIPAHCAALAREHEHHPARRRPAAPRRSPPRPPARPAATAASPAASSSRPAPVTTARCSNTDRVVASDQRHVRRVQLRAAPPAYARQPARLRRQRPAVRARHQPRHAPGPEHRRHRPRRRRGRVAVAVRPASSARGPPRG